MSTMERGHDVSVGDVCMDIHEVSVGEYASCVSTGRCRRQCNGTWHQVAAEGPEGEKAVQSSSCPDVPMRTDWQSAVEDAAVSGFCNGNSPTTRADHPINCVSFEEAMDYCATRGMRLPSGDEWEWASHGGPDRKVSPWGTAIVTDQICWGKPKKRAGTCPRGSHPKDHTPQGLDEMGGSISEWVTAPQRNAKGKVRWAYGASWYAVDDGYARAALGGMQFPARRAETVGFRCAADPNR